MQYSHGVLESHAQTHKGKDVLHILKRKQEHSCEEGRSGCRSPAYRASEWTSALSKRGDWKFWKMSLTHTRKYCKIHTKHLVKSTAKLIRNWDSQGAKKKSWNQSGQQTLKPRAALGDLLIWCCGWKSGSSTGSRGKHFKGPCMARGFIRVEGSLLREEKRLEERQQECFHTKGQPYEGAGRRWLTAC